jgi:hypothetical protein
MESVEGMCRPGGKYFLLILEDRGGDDDYKVFDNPEDAIRAAEAAVTECERYYTGTEVYRSDKLVDGYDGWHYAAWGEDCWGVSVREVEMFHGKGT